MKTIPWGGEHQFSILKYQDFILLWSLTVQQNWMSYKQMLCEYISGTKSMQNTFWNVYKLRIFLKKER
jgi:hypothetical protein